MSSAVKCDRCGKLYESYDGVKLVECGNSYYCFGIFGNGKCKHYDLCEDCMKSLISWIKENKNNE